MQLRMAGLNTIPEVKPGDPLPDLIAAAASREGQTIGAATILVVAQKIVSKSEGCIVDLRTVVPSPFACDWSRRWNRDPRLTELVLQQSQRIVKMDRGLIVSETRHGLVAANAGVDQSNVPGEDFAAVLPADPDASARRLRNELHCGVVLISDTFGRPWREGLVNVAIGVAGMDAVEDLRGTRDQNGHLLTATILARADELAAAAGLLMAKSAGIPVVLIEGYEWNPAEGSMRSLLRDPDRDLFR